MTAPVDAPGPDYLNAVAQLTTELEPYALLLHLLDIELMLGRKRRGLKKNAPRNVDLDLLLVDTLIIQSTPLTLPHPRLHVRAFVLKPLLDLAPDVAIPGQGPARDFLESVSRTSASSCWTRPRHRKARCRRCPSSRRRRSSSPRRTSTRCSEAPDMLAGKYRYVVIEGPIGAGKTSLSRRLAERAGAHMLLEQPQDNPFLERFYRDSARYALPTQMFFLFQRVQQLAELKQLDLFRARSCPTSCWKRTGSSRA